MPVFQTPTLPTTDEPVVPVRVSAENAVAMRSEPDEDGWISITSEPVEEKDISTLVAAAMEKPAASEQAAAAAPVDETEPVDTYQYQYPPIELFEKSQDETDPGAQEELKANAQKLVDTLESFGVRTRVLDISRGPSVTRYEVQPMAGVKISRITSLADDIALNLAVADVRMEAPIPGKPAVGIEVPNHKKTPVYIRSVFESQSFLRMTSPLGIALGKAPCAERQEYRKHHRKFFRDGSHCDSYAGKRGIREARACPPCGQHDKYKHKETEYRTVAHQSPRLLFKRGRPVGRFRYVFADFAEPSPQPSSLSTK